MIGCSLDGLGLRVYRACINPEIRFSKPLTLGISLLGLVYGFGMFWMEGFRFSFGSNGFKMV